MANKIRVTPEKLKATALSMGESAGKVESLTQSMTATVTTLSGEIWQGDAQAAYITKFNTLQQEVNGLVRMIRNHVDHLNAIAAEYASAEAANLNASNTLSSKVIQ